MENTDMKKCPFCAEWIKTEAVKCRYCGSDLNRKGFNFDMFSTPGYWHRVNEGKQVAGVCTGIAQQLDAPILILPLRLFFILTTIFYGFGVILYIILYILMPPDTHEMQGNGTTHGPIHQPGNGPQTHTPNPQPTGQAAGNGASVPPPENAPDAPVTESPSEEPAGASETDAALQSGDAAHESDNEEPPRDSGESRISDAEFIEIHEAEPEKAPEAGETGEGAEDDTRRQEYTDNKQHRANRLLISIVSALILFTLYIMTLSHVFHFRMNPEPYLVVIGGGIILAGIAMRARGRISATPGLAD